MSFQCCSKTATPGNDKVNHGKSNVIQGGRQKQASEYIHLTCQISLLVADAKATNIGPRSLGARPHESWRRAIGWPGGRMSGRCFVLPPEIQNSHVMPRTNTHTHTHIYIYNIDRLKYNLMFLWCMTCLCITHTHIHTHIYIYIYIYNMHTLYNIVTSIHTLFHVCFPAGPKMFGPWSTKGCWSSSCRERVAGGCVGCFQLCGRR